MKSLPRPTGREAIKAWNRQKIIDATVDVVIQYGIAGTTIARVVALADVSMGLVNVHFRNKDNLLLEVLRQMSDAYNWHWRSRLADASQESVEQLKALLLADFDPEVLNLKTLGIWFAYRAQVRARPEYLDLVGTREREQTQKTVALLRKLNRAGGRDHDPGALARVLAAMIEGMWTEFYLYPNEFDRKKSIEAVFLFLDAMYPGNFGSG